MVCLYVLVLIISPAKVAELIQMHLGCGLMSADGTMHYIGTRISQVNGQLWGRCGLML